MTLDELSRSEPLIQSSADGTDPKENALLAYLDLQARRWTPDQVEAVALAIRQDPLRRRDLETGLGIARQAAASPLDEAGLSAIEEAAQLSKHVIIGGLASFGQSPVVATATVWLLPLLPPLGIPELSP